jgi:hypothetical protein
MAAISVPFCCILYQAFKSSFKGLEKLNTSIALHNALISYDSAMRYKGNWTMICVCVCVYIYIYNIKNLV